MDELPPNVRDLPLVVRADMAMKRAVLKAIEDHRRTGDPLAVWRDGKVVLVPAEELLAPTKGNDAASGFPPSTLPPRRID